MTTVATPTPAPIRELEDIRAGDLNASDLLTLLHWRMLNTPAPQFMDHAEAETRLKQLLQVLQTK